MSGCVICGKPFQDWQRRHPVFDADSDRAGEAHSVCAGIKEPPIDTARPVAATELAGLRMNECEVRFINLGNKRCGSQAVGILTHGCVHEHLDRTPICSSCLLNSRVLFGLHDIWCVSCDKSERSHRCEVLELSLERFAVLCKGKGRVKCLYYVKVKGE